jgi:N-methylhydantoinase A
LRYEQQGFEVSVPVPAASVRTGASLDGVIAAFHALHERLYGVRFDVPVELVALRVVATGATPAVESRFEAAAAADVSTALIETRSGWFDGAWHDTPNYDRDRLALGMRVEGPAIIRQYDSTTVLLPDHHAVLDEHGHLLIWPNAGETK